MKPYKANYTCKVCGKKVEVSKYSYEAIASELCRPCKMKQTYKNNPSLTKRAAEKRKSTCNKKYGCDNVAQNSEVQKRWVETKLDRYGYAGVFQDPSYQEVVQEAAHSKEAYLKRKQTCLERYGAEHHTQTDAFIEKREKAYLKKTGYRNPMQDPKVVRKVIDTYGRLGAVKNYEFEDQYFDSSWELAYFIYLRDEGKQFMYHPDTPLEYFEDEKQHFYYPDFLIEGQFVEIKGSQFFNEAGEPFNKYLSKFWWGKYEALKENNVKILLHEDMKPVLKYVKEKYGKTFLKDHRVQKDSKKAR